MDNSQIKSKIESILKQEDRLWNEDKTDLNQTLLLDLVDKIDEQIVNLLLQDNDLREKFFIKIKDVYVFKTNEFKFFMEEHRVNNSFTQYKNRIGLTDGKRFIKDTEDVVLDFPYKDCVLEGGQSTEEGVDNYFEYSEKNSEYEKKQAKRKEIFFNQILAKDEIDRLFDEKALVNWKRYTRDGKQEVSEIKRDDNGTIRENMIIKGNNLLALHSLKKQFAGKVKLIYIDPPYNTLTYANTFAYNNTFNHSTWLTFMKNRIEIAKVLLKEDGLFVTTIDHYELFYLGVLADEIFGRDNRLGVIASVHNPGGRQDDKFFPTAHENILFYAKNINNAKIFKLALSDSKLKQFKLQDKYGRYKLRGFRRSGNNSNRADGPGLYYPVYYDPKNHLISLEKKENYIEILPIDDKGVEKCWRWGKNTFLEKMEKYIEIRKINERYDIYVKERECDYEGEKAKTIWTNNKYTGQTGTNSLKTLFGKKIFTYPKSPYVMKDILKITTEANDIILDYHAGSGTTAHAALQLNKEERGKRRFILVEQMDYINTVSCPRVQKVMKKENIDDSFIYFELAKWNEKAKEEILACESLEELLKFFDTLYEKYFLNYNLKIKEFKEKVIKEDNFRRLSLDEQKKMFLTMIDLNQMYVQKTEMADKIFGISEKDQELTTNFYNI
jgi:adenine-specific DNA-methyltransferase